MIPYDVWAEIDLAAIAQNIRNLRAGLTNNARLMAVVKANAYGHGAVPVAGQALAAGADCLAVARLAEALELRYAGISCPILIFGHTPPEMAGKLMDFDLIQTVYAYADARDLDLRAQAEGRAIRVHVKIDTGMGRLGVAGWPDSFQGGSGDAAEEIAAICRLPSLIAEGAYTHFATADSPDPAGARLQLEAFLQILSALDRRGISFSLRHAANSAAAINLPETHLDMVRPGISIYGCYPSRDAEQSWIHLEPAMSLRARIVHLKSVGPGFRVSYGWTEQTREKTVIATVPIGYADGYDRHFSSRGQMSLRGFPVPVIGRVCMDHTMIDVGAVPDPACGEPVLIFGRDTREKLAVDHLAQALGTIHYEVLSRISARIPRIYKFAPPKGNDI
ncbi:MAG: alanine racemase [Desulfosalsimonas sp.]|uniref:alanine racemase n=1 Tax=Desulfosalsimonas sp. TaxID=3073848 RepID=UPI00397048B7